MVTQPITLTSSSLSQWRMTDKLKRQLGKFIKDITHFGSVILCTEAISNLEDMTASIPLNIPKDTLKL